MRVFKTYLEGIFLYNSELWTLTSTLQKQIDSFQRKQLRKVLGIFWPKIIKTKDLYERTNHKPWSRTIKRRRLIWLGHVLRLDPSTPARKALKHFIVPAQRPAGRSKTTWMGTVLKDIMQYTDVELVDNDDENHDRLGILCSDRQRWKNVLNSIMLSSITNTQ